MPPFEEVIDTPDQAVQTLGATMDRLRQLAYRIPPDEDGHGAVAWQEERDRLYGLLAEAGSLLYTIGLSDGVPYRAVRDAKLLTKPYIHQIAFNDLMGRINTALDGNIMAAAMDSR